MKKKDQAVYHNDIPLKRILHGDIPHMDLGIFQNDSRLDNPITKRKILEIQEDIDMIEKLHHDLNNSYHILFNEIHNENPIK